VFSGCIEMAVRNGLLGKLDRGRIVGHLLFIKFFPVHHPDHHLSYLFRNKWLLNKINSPKPHCFHRQFNCPVSRYNDNPYVRPDLPHLAEHFHPIHSGHMEIQKNEAKLLLFEFCQSFLSVLGTVDLHSQSLQRH
jgi:hypothetical protein